MSRGTLDPARCVQVSITRLSLSLAGFPKTILLPYRSLVAVRTPACTHTGLGSFPFARHYSGNRVFFLFLPVLRCFSSRGSLCKTMDSLCSDWSLSSRVSPFRNLRIIGYLLLPVAYRSLSRLSSALSAKASTLCSYQLDQLFVYVASYTLLFWFYISKFKLWIFDVLLYFMYAVFKEHSDCKTVKAKKKFFFLPFTVFTILF